ncbi:MAG: hypothetical protein COZ49_02145 [Candidatus Yonathbacteria bacterium CG_4_10_14_3_um_filter_47_65]|uniref:Uncharacterized protein n=2 Tax=Parcubacteria group TaxID=1794811 RepID=A0A2M8D5E2_9BACT|nr:MAG: hypothetical protein AUJ44_03995 [Candidatus Nomurabacteria bacterium CG1_02_47_685]PIP03800.1 MAG: hypothetical protein COX54_02320 [Candidatus Yonathbacteria bacterium CG23_combo_of_CG06-09_8_20_14_all_46_18]PIQ32518.1 MAG: hypothetical protein COW61_01460 [Candidatus Yonathbacteria bacterium CG17_big_fil_post_rev_8_21_14_2_50_46_19]PIX56414.1 MAG: hypothetical protein COZ49_02145 [Candidatus Yonathbacteria bacterium CG_4_10_14_3_um_filter_47_65]PIY57959.1 MAG: hypothetical protein CO
MFPRFTLNLRIGFFLATRQIRRTSPWTTVLIISVMVLTFLNLVVVSGMLVGLVQGIGNATRKEYTSDIIISTLDNKKYIEESANITSLLGTIPEIDSLSRRYVEGAILEANYASRKENEKPNTANVQIFGIDPADEDAVTGLAAHIIDGSYLSSGDYDQIILGNHLLTQYILIEDPNLATLDNVGVGTKIRISVANTVREVTIKGIMESKVDLRSRNAFMIDTQFRNMIGRNDRNVDAIAVLLKKGADPVAVRDKLIRDGVTAFAKVQTYDDAQPKFVKDVVKTFNILGTVFGSIGIVVSSITIFIVIFINAITRRKFIGILKAIGIRGQAIEISYIFQSIFYAVIGSSLGLVLVYSSLVPFFLSHPIDFPFSDGILVAPPKETFIRMGLLVLSTVVAGFIPARMIVRKNTLNSILGRN